MLSTGNIFTEITLNKHNTTLIIGENGAGKSSLLDALTFALFGKPFRDVNKPQLVNTITKKHMVVEIEFSIGSVDYLVRRGMKPSLFEVYKDGNLLNQEAESRDYQALLERQILKLNYKSFCQVVVLGSATYTPFMKLVSQKRREIVEDLLDLQIFTTMNVLLKERISDNNEQLNVLQGELKLAEERIRLTKQHLTQLAETRDALIAEKQTKIREIKQQIQTYNEEYESYAIKLFELRNQIQDHDKLRKRADKLKSLSHQIEAKLGILNKDIEFFNTHDTCPTCRQSIEEQFRVNTIAEKAQEIDEVNVGFVKLSEEIDKVSKSINNISKIIESITEIELERHRIQTQITSLQQYCTEIEEEISKFNTIGEQTDSVSIELAENKLQEVEQEIMEAKDIRQLYQVAAALLKDSGIKARIIRQYVPIINKLINKYLSAMDFFVRFELDEEFNETIKSRHRDDFTYGSFSEGEKQRINLAILFAWRAVAKLRNSVATNLMIMDEVFDSSMDGVGADALIDIIHGVSPDTNIFVISHKEQMIDKFDQCIKFVKKSNFSTIKGAV